VIVRSAQDRLLLIAQPDHAYAARSVMEHCVSLAPRPRRAAILRAIGEHDNGWDETDAAPAVNPSTRNVFDFTTVPLSVRHGVWPRAVSRLKDDLWAATLVAQHAITVYDRFRSQSEWTPFFAEMEAIRDRLLRESGMGLEDLLPDYAYVRLGDLISLTFCTGWTDEHRYGEWTVLRSGARVVVTPDVFGGAVIPIQVSARDIANRRFESDAELRQALGEAVATTLRGEVAGRA
jgi:hypothetical protein